MYQDEAEFGRISKLGKCWAPKGIRPSVTSHYIREYRYGSSTSVKPANIGFELIPPYTPEMNPIEQVWAGLKSNVHREWMEFRI